MFLRLHLKSRGTTPLSSPNERQHHSNGDETPLIFPQTLLARSSQQWENGGNDGTNISLRENRHCMNRPSWPRSDSFHPLPPSKATFRVCLSLRDSCPGLPALLIGQGPRSRRPPPAAEDTSNTERRGSRVNKFPRFSWLRGMILCVAMKPPARERALLMLRLVTEIHTCNLQVKLVEMDVLLNKSELRSS